MSSSSYPKAFNNVLDQLFQELLGMFPGNSKIKLNYNLFQTLAKTNVKKPAAEFMESAIPHLEMIANRDEAIMFLPNRPEFVDKLNAPALWAEMSDASKTTLWDYIITLLKLSYQFIEVPVEVKNTIEYVISC